jgi:hypothetical protein
MSKKRKPQRCTCPKTQAQQDTPRARVQVEVMLHQKDSLDSRQWQANKKGSNAIINVDLNYLQVSLA